MFNTFHFPRKIASSSSVNTQLQSGFHDIWFSSLINSGYFTTWASSIIRNQTPTIIHITTTLMLCALKHLFDCFQLKSAYNINNIWINCPTRFIMKVLLCIVLDFEKEKFISFYYWSFLGEHLWHVISVVLYEIRNLWDNTNDRKDFHLTISIPRA